MGRCYCVFLPLTINHNNPDLFWLQIPFDDFVLTNSGELVSREMTMMTHRVRTIGISILGGNSGVEGRYELGLDEIKAVNEVRLRIIFFGFYDHVRLFRKDDLDVISRSEC